MTGFDRVFGFCGAADMGKDHPVRAAIQRVQNMRVACRLRADQHRLPARVRGQYAKVKRSAIKRRMFGVEHEAIKAAKAEHLNHMRVRGFDPCASK
jgi:hypothetical protein